MRLSMIKSSMDEGAGPTYAPPPKGPRKKMNALNEDTCKPFIISTTSKKPDAAARKLIRSHVMAGRNRTKPLGIPIKLQSWDKGSATDEFGSLQASSPNLDISGAGLSMVKFADEMQPYMLDLVFQFFTIIGQALFPIEMCMDVDLRNTVWFEYMHIDAACLHSTLWATQNYFDLMSHPRSSKRSMLHESKTLSLLQNRLTQGDHESISDSTIAVVVVLVLNTALSGDPKTAITHMTGLSRMVNMRGGLRAFKNSMHLQTKICRADLCIALVTGAAPVFSSTTHVSWSRLLATTDDKRWALPKELSALTIDLKLEDIWADLKCFTVLSNLAFQTGRKLDPETFNEILTSIMYRATLLDVSPQPVIRVLHLGILAICSTVFLQADRMKVRFQHLGQQLRKAIFALDDHEQDTLGVVTLWCLVATGLSAITDVDEEWFVPLLRDHVQKEGAKSWEEVRKILRTFLWIDALHDKGGKKLYDHALRI